MLTLFALLLFLLGAAEPRHVLSDHDALGNQRSAVVWNAGSVRTGEPAGEPDSRGTPNQFGGVRIAEPLKLESDANLKRISRDAKDGSSKKRDQHSPHNYRYPRPYDPDGYFTTPESAQHISGVRGNTSDRGAVLLQNPLYPVTESSYWAYAVMLFALILFAVGIVGNLALMCIVWHNYYLKSTWNSILASLAVWDFLVLFFCLPVVVFNELTTKRLLGDLSCRIVPYMEVKQSVVLFWQLCHAMHMRCVY